MTTQDEMAAYVLDRTEIINSFMAAAATRAAEKGISPVENDWNLVSVAEEAGVNLFQFTRDTEFLNGIWVAFLSIMREHFKETDYKYTSIAGFLEHYPEFGQYNIEEQNNLMHSANWMAILFTMIPAAKNKGLVLQVIPLLVEGPYAKYITGSGQTEATSNRVHVYEKEGNIILTHRTGMRGSKKKTFRKQSIKKTPMRKRSDSATGSSGRRQPRLFESGGEFEGMVLRRPRSGTGSSSTDGEFRSGDELHDEEHERSGSDDEFQNGEDTIEEEGEADLGDFGDVLQLLRDTSASGQNALALSRIAHGDMSPTGAIASSSSLGWFDMTAMITAPESPGGLSLSRDVPLERVYSWGGINTCGSYNSASGSDPLHRLSSAEFQNQPAFPPEHPSYHSIVDEVVQDPSFDMFDAFLVPKSKEP